MKKYSLQIFFSLLVVVILLMNCIKSDLEQREINNIEKSDLMIGYKNTFDTKVQGIWVLGNYIDSILAYKSIGKDRITHPVPSLFAVMMTINKEGFLKSYGTLTSIDSLQITQYSDSLCTIGKWGYGRWKISLNEKDKTILMNNIKKINGKDTLESKVYTYRKSDEIFNLMEGKDTYISFVNALERFFANKLIVGKYEIFTPSNKKGDIVYFNKDGTVKNFDSFDIFSVNAFTGTLHTSGTADGIDLIDLDSDKRVYYNWKFKNDNLILSEFVLDSVKMSLSVVNVVAEMKRLP